jgi:hypothetical protein
VKLYPVSQRCETVVQEVKLYPVSQCCETIIGKVKRNSIRFDSAVKPPLESEQEPKQDPVARIARPSTHLMRCCSRTPKTVCQCWSARHEAGVNLRYNPIKTDRPTLVRPA